MSKPTMPLYRVYKWDEKNGPFYLIRAENRYTAALRVARYWANHFALAASTRSPYINLSVVQMRDRATPMRGRNRWIGYTVAIEYNYPLDPDRRLSCGNYYVPYHRHKFPKMQDLMMAPI